MPRYRIQEYELWCSSTDVDAQNPSDAIARLRKGEGDPVDDSSEYIQVDDSRGMTGPAALIAGIDESYVNGGIVQSIRQIEMIDVEPIPEEIDGD